MHSSCLSDYALSLSEIHTGPKISVPSIASALLSTYGAVLHVAPRSEEWALSAPGNVRFDLQTGGDPHVLIDHIQRITPSAIVVSDQVIDAKHIKNWRTACPSEKLVLIRRGTSLDKIDLAACKQWNIHVSNTPGVNAPYVADYIVSQLNKDTTLPRNVRLLGCGDVGKEVVRKITSQHPKCTMTVLTHGKKTHADLELSAQQKNVTLVVNWNAVFEDATAVVIALAVNQGTVAQISKQHIDSMQKNSRIVCVSKPDVFSDASLLALSQREDLEFTLDYGPATLVALKQRLERLGIPPGAWKRPPQLTTMAMASEACKIDLDYAVAVQLAMAALDRFVSRALGDSFAIPTSPVSDDAPVAHVIGCGINGLLQALLLRLAGYQVVVCGGREEADGPSHKHINMRHLSATETTARPVHNPHLFAFNNDLVIRINLGGMELFQRFLEDNPHFAQFIQEGLVRAFPEGMGDHDKDIGLQSLLSRQTWPGGKKGAGSTEFSAEEFAHSYKIPGVARAIKVPGYDLEFKKFIDALFLSLQQAGVRFEHRHLMQDEIAQLASSGSPVVTATGVADQSVMPIAGWFVRMTAAQGEAEGLRGLKLHYALPVGVLNCRRDGEFILVSGGQVPHGSTPEETAQVRAQFLEAVATHFPKSYRQAQEDSKLELISCERPGTKDGLSRVQQTGPRQIMVGATYAGGMTQGLLLARLGRDKVLQQVLADANSD